MTALGATDVSQRTKKLNFKCGGFQDDEIQTPWNIVKKTGWVMFVETNTSQESTNEDLTDDEKSCVNYRLSF